MLAETEQEQKATTASQWWGRAVRNLSLNAPLKSCYTNDIRISSVDFAQNYQYLKIEKLNDELKMIGVLINNYGRWFLPMVEIGWRPSWCFYSSSFSQGQSSKLATAEEVMAVMKRLRIKTLLQFLDEFNLQNTCSVLHRSHLTAKDKEKRREDYCTVKM